MKKNLRSACSLFLVFLFFTVGFVGLGSAEVPTNYSFNESKYTHHWDGLSSPVSEYKIWGYPGKLYNFTTEYNRSLFSDDMTMVFYWNCKSDPNDFTPVEMNNTTHHRPINNTISLSNCTHIWNENGTYYVSVGVFKGEDPINVSYWAPVEIRDNCTIKVQNFFMLEDNEGSGCNKTYNVLIPANSTENSANSSNSSDIYCGYVGNGYSFNVTLNATFINTDNLTSEDSRTIKETTTEIDWGDSSSDNS